MLTLLSTLSFVFIPLCLPLGIVHCCQIICPSFRCPACGHANDAGFLFCQRCAYQIRHLAPQPAVLPDVYPIAPDDRMRMLTNVEKDISYVRQEDSLQNELQAFLIAQPENHTIATVTPRDLCLFFVYKDCEGKTQVRS